MAKQQVSQRLIFKIHSSRFKKNKWNLNLSIGEAKKNEELIALGDSQVMRFISEITGEKIDEEKIKQIQQEINYIKRQPTTNENKKQIKKLNKQKDKLKFVKDYMCLIIDKNKDYDIATNEKKGIFLNGVKFKRLLATTGGAKKSTIVFVSERVHKKLKERITNGRDLEKKLVAGKLEAYQALACSTSIPVSDPKGILVVNDCETQFKTNARLIYDKEGIEEPIMEDVTDYDVTLSDSDGYGLILPELSKQWANDIDENYMPSGFCIRNSFTKGMVFTFDFRDFSDKIATNNIVTDAWGNAHNINDIQLILTTSMLKLWDSYKSIDHYLECCKKNGYTFNITTATEEELDNERNLNYQFIQSLDLSDEDIEELVTPTIDEINDILDGDYRKSLLFLRGIHLTDKNINTYNYDFVEALMADKRMIKDPFVKQRIHHMIKKRINDAKIGVLKVRGNFSIVSGDPYSLCQSIFGLQVTGLLPPRYFYSNYWSSRNVKEVACFRAPMTCHNNIRKLKLANTEQMQYWYKYMNRCTIFNSWDITAHALNGLDKDSDKIFTSDNKIILKGTHKTDAIICMQKRADKILVKEADLIKANKKSFGDEIGSITNRITTMFDVRAKFSKDSEEYNILNYRISCGQHFQQNAIDKTKGIISKPMPKEWYEYKANKIEEGDNEETIKRKKFNLRILADKKPYFFNYIYPQQMKKYKNFISNSNKNCLRRFGVTINELRLKENKTEAEEVFLKYYDIKMPVESNSCVMNKICWRIEKEFDSYLSKKMKYDKFDYHILMTDKPISNRKYNQISKLYQEYNKELSQYAQTIKKERIDKEEKETKRIMFKEQFKDKALEICNNEEDLANIVIELCYKKNSSKQFAWDISGKQIIRNLLVKNNYTLKYPALDENGDIEFGGFKFSMQEKVLEEELV